MTDPAAAVAFMLGGKATVTLRSLESGARYTYRIRLAGGRGPDRVWTVALLNGPDNESRYVYIGRIRGSGYAWGRPKDGTKPFAGADAGSVKAFKWAFARLAAGAIPGKLEVWHEGRCGRCGRKLTVPESVASGFGPECRARDL